MQRHLLMLLFLFFCCPSMAQTDSNVQYIFLPPVFETVKDSIMVKPATIKWKKDGIPICCISECPPDFRMWVLRGIPPQYETISYQILKQAAKKLIYHPPIFETVKDSVMVKPAMEKWGKGVCGGHCCGILYEPCQTWCLEEKPAEYQIITRQILKSPAYFEDPSIVFEEEKEIFEENQNQIEAKASFKKSIEVQNTPTLLQFFPNPASYIVTIEVQKPIEELVVTDFTGKTLLHFKDLNKIISFSVNTFPSGIYFLRYPDGNFWKSERLVVLRN